MFRRVTRSQAQAKAQTRGNPEMEMVILEDDRAGSKKGRALTVIEKEKARKLLMAFMVQRQRKGSRTDYQDWSNVRDYLKPIFELVVKKEGKVEGVAPTKEGADAVLAESKWREFLSELFLSGATHWATVSREIQSAHKNLEYLEDTLSKALPEGNMRNRVLARMGWMDYFKMIGVEAQVGPARLPELVRNLTDEQKLDLIMTFENPNSVMFSELLDWAETGSFDMVELILDDLRVGDHRVNPNTHKNGETILRAIARRIGNVYMNINDLTYRERSIQNTLDYFSKLIGKHDFDYTIVHEKRLTKVNLVSYALSKLLYERVEPMWRFLQILLKKKPLREFYIGTEGETGSKYYGHVSFVNQPKKHYITNATLLKTLTGRALTWLVQEGGMDVSEGYKDISLLESVPYMLEELKYNKDDYEKKLEDNRKLLLDLTNQINELTKTVAEVTAATRQQISKIAVFDKGIINVESNRDILRNLMKTGGKKNRK